MSKKKQTYQRIIEIEKRLDNLEMYYKSHLDRLHKLNSSKTGKVIK